MKLKKKPNISYITIQITENKDGSSTFNIHELIPKKALTSLTSLTKVLNAKISDSLRKVGAEEE
jgi:hypothetical protein